MSTWTKVRDAIEEPFEEAFTWLKGTKLGSTIVSAGKAAITELSEIGAADLEKAVETIGAAALGGLAIGGTEGAIAAGIAAAPAAFKAAEKDISTTTTHTLVSSIVTQLQADESARASAGVVTAAGSTAAAS